MPAPSPKGTANPGPAQFTPGPSLAPMADSLKVAIGQCSAAGRKETNQDFHGVYIPKEPQLTAKGVALAIADGISSSEVSHIASETAVAGFLEDYFCTSDAWSVKKAGQRVLAATNSWLYSQTQNSPYRDNRDRGYVCTFSALIIKSHTAHVFHIGDARIYRLRDDSLEQLTHDHRVWVSHDKSYLSHALGISPHLEIDYLALDVEVGDVFVLATDGVYDYADAAFMIDVINQHGRDLDAAAEAIIADAHERGSPDNLTVQIVRVDALPRPSAHELHPSLTELKLPPALEARMVIDGYKIVRELHASHRSHVLLAVDSETNARVVIKTPSTEMREDAAALERFLMEEWIARRINSPHVLKPYTPPRRRNYVYVVTEYAEGETLTQWMIDHPQRGLTTVRALIEQIAKGLQAFHRLEMLHQDLRPDNIMIDQDGTAKIIDFGAVRVAGLMEIANADERDALLGTAQYIAPEYLLGEPATAASDIFSLGVIAYQLLTGRLPYRAEVAKTKTRAEQARLRYDSLLNYDSALPQWVDEAIRKAVHPDPRKRYTELSEFVFDLSHPNPVFLTRTRPPLMERNPLAFWKGVSLVLALIIVALVILRIA